MPELIPVPTLCPVTMAIRLDCGHTLFSHPGLADRMLAQVMMIKHKRILCLPCGPGEERRIVWVWDM